MRESIFIGADVANPEFSFTDDEVISVSSDMSVSMDLSEIAADVAEINVKCSDTSLLDVQWATPVYIYIDNDLNAKLYLKTVTRTANNQYSISAISAIGLMEYDTYYGDYLSGESFESVAKKILLTNGFTWAGFGTKMHRGMLGNMTYNGIAATHFHAIAYSEWADIDKHTIANADFKLNKCILNDLPHDPYPTATSVKIPLWGSMASDELIAKTSTVANEMKNANCGIYMNMTRASTVAPWPDYGEVVFWCFNRTFSLGTPTAPKTFTISIHIPNRTATINNTTYSLTYFDPTSAFENIYPPEFPYGGGWFADVVSETLYTRAKYYKPPIYCDIEYGSQYTAGLYTEVDPPQLSYETNVRLKGKATGQIYVISTGEDTQSEDYAEWSVLSGNVSVIQKNPQEYQKEIANHANYDAVSEVKVYGWIPICTKREALHQLLFSTGVTLIKDGDGNYLFTGLSNTETAISDTFIYEGGSVERFEKVNALEITEHSFIYSETAAQEVLFENDTVPITDAIVAQYSVSPVYTGSAPTVDPSIELLDYNCNACVISGKGQIKQIPYFHSEGVVTRVIGNYPDGKTVAVENCGLITMQNSEAILDRVEEYYRNSTTVKFSIVAHGERCGARYSYKNPFKELSSGILYKATHQHSGIEKVSCEFIEGFNPLPPGGGYRNYVALTGSGSWTVPESVYEEPNPRIRIVLIGGGTGGESGLKGPDGIVTAVNEGSNYQLGGLGGKAGEGGKVLDVTLRNPPSIITYSCGTGGAGAPICQSTSTPNVGTEGTATTIQAGSVDYTSEDGRTFETGYINVLSGNVYAKPWETLNWNQDPIGIPGITGFLTVGQGSNGGYTVKVPIIGAFTTPPGGQATDIYNHTSNSGSNGTDAKYNGQTVAFGGGGGGAACGGTAGNGTNGYVSSGVAYAGNGGKGADATAIPPKATSYDSQYYGYGGHGGYGGGAGGNSGAVATNGRTGTGGAGGYGGAGGTGGDGCVIIYY